MVNQQYLEFLVKLESVAAYKDKAAINDVRGQYVKHMGTDNKYVQFLGQLESVASESDKKAINAVRGRYAMMEMCTTPRGMELAKAVADDDERNRRFELRKMFIHESIARGCWDVVAAVKLMDKAKLESLCSSI